MCVLLAEYGQADRFMNVYSTLLNLNSLIVNIIIHIITKSPAGIANTKA